MSPYLGLFTETFDPDTVQYNTFVRPLQEQQNIRQRLQQQQQQQQRFEQQQTRQRQDAVIQLQRLAAQSAFNPAGSQTTPPTGHPTAFGYFSHFYGTSANSR